MEYSDEEEGQALGSYDPWFGCFVSLQGLRRYFDAGDSALTFHLVQAVLQLSD